MFSCESWRRGHSGAGRHPRLQRCGGGKTRVRLLFVAAGAGDRGLS